MHNIEIIFFLNFLHRTHISCFCKVRKCSTVHGVEMTAVNPRYTHLNNSNVCCPASCGSFCNDCYGNDALQSYHCSYHGNHATNQHTYGKMCYEGPGGWENCCAPSIPADKICGHFVRPPCRLGKYRIYSIVKFLLNQLFPSNATINCTI